jgi:hypothetical protein
MSTEQLEAKLTNDEALLAASIGANVIVDLQEALKKSDGLMNTVYKRISKDVRGRSRPMAKAIMAAIGKEAEAFGYAVGTVNVVRTCIMYHVKEGKELPPSYKEAREAYDERPKAKREPRQVTGEKEEKTEGETVTEPVGEVSSERAQLLSQIAAQLATMDEDDLTNVALWLYEYKAGATQAKAA